MGLINILITNYIINMFCLKCVYTCIHTCRCVLMCMCVCCITLLLHLKLIRKRAIILMTRITRRTRAWSEHAAHRPAVSQRPCGLLPGCHTASNFCLASHCHYLSLGHHTAAHIATAGKRLDSEQVC